MMVSAGSLNSIFAGFKTSFNKGFQGAASTYGKFTMDVPSSSREETYAWMGQFPKMREWIGERYIKQLTAYGYTIKNKKFESTVEVLVEDIEDDKIGVYAPLLGEMGRDARQHSDELVYDLVAGGFTGICYDGKPFFAADHPVQVRGQTDAWSNLQDGSGPAWFLFDTSRAVKPMVLQMRVPYTPQQLTGENAERVFLQDRFLYGVRARLNAGYGLWQRAFGSTAELTAESYAAARAAMATLRSDEGRLLGIKADTLVVPSGLEAEARRLILNDTRVVTWGAARFDETPGCGRVNRNRRSSPWTRNRGVSPRGRQSAPITLAPAPPRARPPALPNAFPRCARWRRSHACCAASRWRSWPAS